MLNAYLDSVDDGTQIVVNPETVTYDINQLEEVDVTVLNDLKLKNQSLTERHKKIFLKYLKQNENIMNEPRVNDKVIKDMTKDLNALGFRKNSRNWQALLSGWINKVKQHENDKRYSKLTPEDDKLIEILKLDSEDIENNLTEAQLSCILDQIEINGLSPKLWMTIQQEMELLGCEGKPCEYWENSFDQFCTNVKKKKISLDKCNENDVEKYALSREETRLYNYLLKETNDLNNYKLAEAYANNCRICLLDTINMLNLFDKNDDDSSFADKITQCACITPITKDDGLPQLICHSCILLVETAFKFKKLCEQSDCTLRELDRENAVKQETVEYLDADQVYDVGTNYEILDFQAYTDNEENDVEVDEEELENIDQNDDELCINKEKNSNSNVDCYLEIEKIITTSVEKSNKKEKIENKIKGKSKKDKIKDDTESTAIHQCEACGIIFKNIATLKMHMKTHINLKPYQCNYCAKHFKTRLSLKIHIRSHTGERPYVCEVCGKGFTQDGSLVYHRAIHNDEKKFICDICDYRARSKNDLKIHLRHHTGQRPYNCNICSTRFTTSSNLQKHVRRHTGQKNFKTCGKAFKTCSAVNNHRAIHSAVREFKCPHCAYRASTKANLKIHDRTHTQIKPYTCRVCQIKFSTASNMHKHIRNIHEKLKTHKCDQCTRSFFSRESVRKHMVTHTGLKPYSCTVCTMSYGWYNGLQKHMRMQHPGIKMPTEKSLYANISMTMPG